MVKIAFMEASSDERHLITELLQPFELFSVGNDVIVENFDKSERTRLRVLSECGCRRKDGYICKLQKVDFPNIQISL